MTTICSGCRKSITEYEKEGKDFVLCKKCSRFTPKNNVKAGGKLLMAKKTIEKASNKYLTCSVCKKKVQKDTRNPDKWKGKEKKFTCRSCNKSK